MTPAPDNDAPSTGDRLRRAVDFVSSAMEQVRSIEDGMAWRERLTIAANVQLVLHQLESAAADFAARQSAEVARAMPE